MKNLPKRKSIRLKKYDYAMNGFYYVTICTQNRECLFGEIINGEMGLNRAGGMIKNIWELLPDYYPVGLDALQIMPNHVHFIIQMDEDRARATTRVDAPTMRATTRVARTSFDKRLWQRNYYEHIVRSANDLGRIRRYIENNPNKLLINYEI